MNLREGFAVVGSSGGTSGALGSGRAARAGVQGVFTTFLDPTPASPISSTGAPISNGRANAVAHSSAAQYYSSDASSSSPSVGLGGGRAGRAESSQTSDDSGPGSGATTALGQGLAVRQPRGPASGGDVPATSQRGFTSASSGNWRASEQPVPE